MISRLWQKEKGIETFSSGRAKKKNRRMLEILRLRTKCLCTVAIDELNRSRYGRWRTRVYRLIYRLFSNHFLASHVVAVVVVVGGAAVSQTRN